MDIEYICAGDYYIPNLKQPEENRPIGKWGSMHRTKTLATGGDCCDFHICKKGSKWDA